MLTINLKKSMFQNKTFLYKKIKLTKVQYAYMFFIRNYLLYRISYNSLVLKYSSLKKCEISLTILYKIAKILLTKNIDILIILKTIFVQSIPSALTPHFSLKTDLKLISIDITLEEPFYEVLFQKFCQNVANQGVSLF